MQDSQVIVAEASEWVVRLNAGKLSAGDAEAFQQWLNESDAHRREFREQAALWGLAGHVYDAGAGIQGTNFSLVQAFWSWLQIRPKFAMAGASIAIALVFTIALTVFNAGLLPSNEIEPQVTFATEVGEQRTVELSDGSAIQLNTKSGLEVVFAEKERAVHLLEGEAHFDVARNTERPFRVYAGDSVIEAVGTAFVVHIKNGVVEATVTEGKVKVFTLDAEEKLDTFAKTLDRDDANPVNTVLTAGQKIRYDEELFSVERVEENEMQKQLAWRSGMLLFDGETLENVLMEFERYTTAEFQIVDVGIRDKQIVGYFNTKDTERFLGALEAAFGIAADGSTEGVIRLSKKES